MCDPGILRQSGLKRGDICILIYFVPATTSVAYVLHTLLQPHSRFGGKFGHKCRQDGGKVWNWGSRGVTCDSIHFCVCNMLSVSRQESLCGFVQGVVGSRTLHKRHLELNRLITSKVDWTGACLPGICTRLQVSSVLEGRPLG